MRLAIHLDFTVAVCRYENRATSLSFIMAQDVGMQQLIQRFGTRLGYLEHDRLVYLSERVSMIESIHAVHEKYDDKTKKRMGMVDAQFPRYMQLRRM